MHAKSVLGALMLSQKYLLSPIQAKCNCVKLILAPAFVNWCDLLMLCRVRFELTGMQLESLLIGIFFVIELFIYLLYNSSELETQLDHIVSGYGIICHCSKRGPGKEGAPGMNH